MAGSEPADHLTNEDEPMDARQLWLIQARRDAAAARDEDLNEAPDVWSHPAHSLPDVLRAAEDDDVEFDPHRVPMHVRDAGLDGTDEQQKAALEELAGMDFVADLLDPQVRAAARGESEDEAPERGSTEG